MSEEKRIEQLEKEFDFTLSKISHEIRNPVTLINSFLQILEEKCPEVTNSGCWDDIWDNMEYLKSLLNELSSYNNAKKLHLDATYMDVLLEKVVASVRPTLDYLDIRLEYRICHPLPVMNIDETKLRQALLNLIRNAQEALSPGGHIKITGSCQGSICAISVSDNGPGIAPEHLETIFDPFVTYKKNGSGLGLAITKNIVSAHQGEIQVESTLQGTTFTILLPVL